MNTTFYSGHSLEWTQKFIEALPKKKGLDYAKAVCIAALLQHKYTLTKKREIILNHTDLRNFGLWERNLIKYLPYFEEEKLITWVRKKGAPPKIILNSLPPNYVLNNKKKINKINKTKGTSTTVVEDTSTTVVDVTSTTVVEVEKSAPGRYDRHTDKTHTPNTQTRHTDKIHRQDTQTRPLDKTPRPETKTRHIDKTYKPKGGD